MRHKLPAALSIGLDLDAAAIQRVSAALGAAGDDRSTNRFRLIQGDAFAFLKSYPFEGHELVYCDPPYMHETRGRKNLYRHELTDAQHLELLEIVTSLKARVMISGYRTALYCFALRDWSMATFHTTNRAGKRTTEYLWMNYAAPVELHDYRYLGANFRQRERIKRKMQRWVARLEKMPELERRALQGAMASITRGGIAKSGESACRQKVGGELLEGASPELGSQPAGEGVRDYSSIAEGVGVSG